MQLMDKFSKKDTSQEAVEAEAAPAKAPQKQSIPKSGKGSAGESKKFRRKGPVIIAGLVVAVAASVFLLGGNRNGSGVGTLALSDTTLLSRSNLQSTISATGTVESANSMMVYSTASYTVEAVFVEVGDYVEEGQLLAKLDEKNIRKQIESQEAGLNASGDASAASIAAARDNYQQYKAGLEQGLNSGILSAENSLTSAYNSYSAAVTTYERYKAALEDGTNTSIVNAENAVDAAYDNYISAVNTYDRYKKGIDEGTNSGILSAENSVTSTYNNYIAALNTYERYKAGLDAGENTTLINQKSALRNAESAVDTARDAYRNALSALDDADEAVSRARNEVRNADSDLANAQKQLSGKKNELLLSEDEEGKAVLEREIAGLEGSVSQLEAALAGAENALTQAESARRNCQQQVTGSERSLENAKAAYTDAQAAYNAAVTSVDNQLEDYSTAVDTAYTSYQSALTSLDAAWETARNSLADYYTAVETTYESYMSALESLETTRNTAEDTLEDYETSVETAYESYQSAQTGLDAARESAQNQLQTYKDNLNSAYASANNTTGEVNLRQLRADLETTEITAPVSGTITAVYAEVGSSGAGLLFVIEDVDNLVVSTSVKDYDVGSIRTGMAVTIKSDSTGSDIYDGEITSIAPTANKTPAGTTDTSGDIAFATDVAVTSQDTRLKIGMSVRLNFILDEAKDVLYVPYDAVYQADGGRTCILAAMEREDGTYLLREIPVTTGMENDLDIVVEGAELEAGMRVVSEPDTYLPLAGQAVAPGERPRTASGRMGGF